MQAHPRSSVVMDVAAFKISHSVVVYKDAAALRAARARLSSIGAMGALDESSRNVQNVSAHCARSVTLRTNKARSSQFSEALEEMSQNVQKSSALQLPRLGTH